MPRLNYTATKGMYQDGDTMNASGNIDTASGFLMSDVAVCQKAASIQLESPVYTIKMLTAAGYDGANNNTYNGSLHDVLFTLRLTAGTAVSAVFQVTGAQIDGTSGGGGSNGVTTASDFSGATAVAIAKTDPAATVLLKLAQGLATANTDLGYTAVTTDGDYTIAKIYAVGNGRLSDANATLITTEDITDGGATALGYGIQVGAINGGVDGDSDNTLDDGANAWNTYDSGDFVIEVDTQGNSASQSAANAVIESAAQSIIITAESASDVEILKAAGTALGLPDNAYTTAVTLADPADDSPGQQVTLINGCSYRSAKVTASAIDSGTTVTLEEGDVLKLIWNGTGWVSHPLNFGSPSIA